MILSQNRDFKNYPSFSKEISPFTFSILQNSVWIQMSLLTWSFTLKSIIMIQEIETNLFFQYCLRKSHSQAAFLFQGIVEWNALSDEIKCTNSTRLLRKKLRKHYLANYKVSIFIFHQCCWWYFLNLLYSLGLFKLGLRFIFRLPWSFLLAYFSGPQSLGMYRVLIIPNFCIWIDVYQLCIVVMNVSMLNLSKKCQK